MDVPVYQDAFVLVTGASSGIGRGLAQELARRGQPLILTARRRERLEELQREFAGRVRIEIVAADLNTAEAVDQIVGSCRENGWVVAGLINNAGLGFQRSFSRLSSTELEQMLQVNVAALLDLTYRFLPGMLEAGRGYILNIASTAAFQPVPYFSVYAATKAFVLSWSEGLHEELKGRGILVSCLCPGPVATEFQMVAGMQARFFAKSQNVDEVVTAAMKLLARRGALGWTSIFQRVTSWCSELMPHVVRRRLAAKLMRWSGAE